MDGFKKFFTEVSEVDKNIKDTLSKIPKTHSDLIKGYKFKWEAGNVLKSDKDHVGIIDPNKKTITIAAPWRFSRQITFLHELAHQVWAALPSEIKEKWKIVVKKNPKRDKTQNDEENFAMAYADAYCTNKLVKNNHPDWIAFIKSLPK